MNKQESQNQVSIIINGVRYDAVKGLSCAECAFDKDCNLYMANLCDMLGVNDCGFQKFDKKLIDTVEDSTYLKQLK